MTSYAPNEPHWLHGTVAAAIARQATAHNLGETVLEQRVDATSVVLRMSSWPRAREAEAALIGEDMAVEYLPDDARGHTRIRVTKAVS